MTTLMSGLDPGLIVAAWLTGLAGGSGHCIGMCGGITGALGVRQHAGLAGALRLVTVHLGRVLSYGCAGIIAGLGGSALARTVLGDSATAVLRTGAAVLILLIGLQLLFGRPLLTSVERVGARFWRVLAPQLRKFLPPRGPLSALAVGALWGWLPCGLVYAQLTVAATSGGAATGGLVMVFFGLGTVVSLSAVSVLLQSLGMAKLPRQVSGVLLVLFALWTVAPLIEMSAGSH